MYADRRAAQDCIVALLRETCAGECCCLDVLGTVAIVYVMMVTSVHKKLAWCTDAAAA
jgi:hypothetical protein